MPDVAKKFTYDIDTPAGKFTVTADRELGDQELVAAATQFVRDEQESSFTGQVRGDRNVREAQEGKKVHPYALLGAGVGRAVTDVAGGLYNLATQLPGAVRDVARNLTNVETAGATARGFREGGMEGLKGLVDVRGQLGDTDQAEPTLTRMGRVGTNAAMLVGAKPAYSAAKGAVVGRIGARTAAKEAERTALRTAARQLAGDIPDEVVARGLGGPPPPPSSATRVTGTGMRPAAVSATGQPIGTTPVGTTTWQGGRVSAPRPPVMPPGYGATGMGIPGATAGNLGWSRPTVQIPPKVAPPAGSRVVAPEGVRPAVQPPTANPHVAIREALDELTTESAAAPGRTGHFKLPAVKNPEARLDAAQRLGIGPEPVPEQVHLDSAARFAERRKAQGVSPTGTERRQVATAAADAESPSSAAPVAPSERPKFKATTEQFEKRAAASKRAPVAGKDLESFVAERYKGGEVDYPTLVKDLRDQFGSERAARMLGITRDEVKQLAPGPSRIPARGRDAIAEAERGQAMEGGGLRRVWESVDNERGASPLKVMLPVAGAGVGALAAPAFMDEDATPDAKLGGTLAGAGLGAVGGLVAANPMAALRTLGRARVEGMLSGAAIPKNLATAAGSALTSAVEGTGRTRMAPLREMFAPVKNAREFADAWKRPRPHQTGFVMAGAPRSTSVFAPSRVIGAIDETAQRALRRAGVSQENIDRMLLTKDNDLSALTGAFGTKGEKVGRFFIPFQRTPANAIREGFSELGALGDPNAGLARKALTAGSIPAGAAIGEWAKQDPKRRGLLAGILLAGMGSRALPGTMAAYWRAGRQTVGGLSPVPEMAFDIRTATGLPPAGVKFWQRLLAESEGK